MFLQINLFIPVNPYPTNEIIKIISRIQRWPPCTDDFLIVSMYKIITFQAAMELEDTKKNWEGMVISNCF